MTYYKSVLQLICSFYALSKRLMHKLSSKQKRMKNKWLFSGTSWYPEILISIISTSNDDLINHQERMFLYGKYQIARISKDKILSKE